MEIPRTILDLVHLEEVFDCLDLYLWLSFRFPSMFPEKELIRGIQSELDQIIHDGVQNIVKLIHRTNSIEQNKDLTSNEDKTIELIETIEENSLIDDKDQIKSSTKKHFSSTINSEKILHSYLNALKSQAETRGFQFNSNEDLIPQLINKGFISQRSINKLEKQILSAQKTKS